MKRIYSFIVGALVLLSYHSQAQSSIAIDTNAFDSLRSNTFVLNYQSVINSPSFGVKLYNRSGTAFSDSLSFMYMISSGGVSAVYDASNTNGSGIYFAARGVSIPPHDSITLFSLLFSFNSPQFVIGSSTVVIWPIVYTGGSIAVDSARATLTLTYPAGVHPIKGDGLVMYASDGVLYIKNEAENKLGDLRIYNSMGKLAGVYPLSYYNEISLKEYTSGLYLAEVILANGKRVVYKVVKD